jgi:hypothetical protein
MPPSSSFRVKDRLTHFRVTLSESRRVTAYAYLANPVELEVLLHPVMLRRLFSSFWPWRRSSPLRSSLWRGEVRAIHVYVVVRLTKMGRNIR